MIKRAFGLTAILATFVVWLVVPVANAQLPTGPNTAVKTDFSVDNPPAEFEVVQDINDFAPGAWSTPHVHGGPAYITVVEGEMTFRSKDSEKTFKSGESWMEKPGDLMQIGNQSLSPARTLVTFLLPKGAQLTTAQEAVGLQSHPALEPKKIETKYPTTSVRGPFDLIEVQQDFAPGAVTPVHTHGGPAYITVMSGQLTLVQNGTAKTYSSGDSWMESPGQYMQVVNRGTTAASTFVTFLLPKGATLTSNQQQDAPSSKSSGSQVQQQDAPLASTPSTPGWLFPSLGIVALIIVGSGAVLVRRRYGKR